MQTASAQHGTIGSLAEIAGRKPIASPNSFQAAMARYIADDKRRVRLIAFLDRVADPDEFGVRIGRRRVPFGFLSTDALEDLRADVLRDAWAARRRLRDRRRVAPEREAA